MKKNVNLLLASMTILLFSCQKPKAPVLPATTYNKGVFVIEEGQFNNGTGTLSFIDGNSNKITNDVFGKRNVFALGNIFQSMNVIDNLGYLVVNNANKIHIVNMEDMLASPFVINATSPRTITKSNNNKAYITCWGNNNEGYLSVLNLITKSIEKNIPLGAGPEDVVVYGNRAYVSMSGGLGNNDSIAVINTDNDSLLGKYQIGANPRNMVQDVNNNIWILCKGAWNATFTALQTKGSLHRYNVLTNTIDKTFNFSSSYAQPDNLKVDGSKNRLYYTYDDGVYKFDITNTTFDMWPLVPGNYYGLGVNPYNGLIYTANAKDFASAGEVKTWNTNGTVLDSFKTGLIPNGFYFRNN